MKVGQLIEYMKIFFSKIMLKNGVVPELFFFKKKALYEVKESGLQLSFNMSWQPSYWHIIKTNCLTLDH